MRREACIKSSIFPIDLKSRKESFLSVAVSAFFVLVQPQKAKAGKAGHPRNELDEDDQPLYLPKEGCCKSPLEVEEPDNIPSPSAASSRSLFNK